MHFIRERETVKMLLRDTIFCVYFSFFLSKRRRTYKPKIIQVPM